MQTKKTDNHNPGAKLELRRHFLRTFHQAEPIRVLDCCQATGLLWHQLRKEFDVASYWGVDVKPKKGRIKVDSVRVLDQPGWDQNVVDVDAYGSPWKHWFAILKHCAHPVTVFLTWGRLKTAGGAGGITDTLLLPMGINFQRTKLPPNLCGKLDSLALMHALTVPSSHGLQISFAMQAPGHRDVDYYGVRLEKAA